MDAGVDVTVLGKAALPAVCAERSEVLRAIAGEGQRDSDNGLDARCIHGSSALRSARKSACTALEAGRSPRNSGTEKRFESGVCLWLLTEALVASGNQAYSLQCARGTRLVLACHKNRI